ncbi:hypothetical protein N0V94_005253 [Neodidymelliopsis sp. IMI 364377]|nr:hypothetical protein N0V94_005253 [Neodidymelliopsis sp. IMI 364377]
MSASQVTIVIKNKSDEEQRFMIFSEPPAFSSSTGKAWTNVWGLSPGVGAKNGHADFAITEEYYAVCGISQKELQTDLKVQTTDDLPMVLGSGDKKGSVANVKMVDDGVVIDKVVKGEVENDGAFGIRTAEYDLTRYTEDAFCGMGLKSPNPMIEDVTPVAVWQAKPNQDYQITPKRQYYVSTGKYTPGTIVNVTQLGQVARIDFTGRSENVAVVILNNQLAYESVTYTFSNGFKV